MTHCDDYNALNAHPLYALVLSKFENRVGQIEQVGRDPNKSIPILNTAFSVLVYCTFVCKLINIVWPFYWNPFFFQPPMEKHPWKVFS